MGCPEFMAKGYGQQLRSIVMLKNHDHLLPLKGADAHDDKDPELYIPKRR